ncbi:Cof-type HAD-IIB family hydrolase [Gluconobacter sphaericus]|uniref:Cof-type HAD-IIB family hydrolase n=1 Tax=Gluconobacter sphaericus TaxID=574987 RepID=UPI002012510E|nr:Cof-type HAD-IIB family hydrolase [Gluconobacter sphaericus]
MGKDWLAGYGFAINDQPAPAKTLTGVFTGALMSVDLDAIHAALPPLPQTIRMVVSDMDGTLLTPDKTIAPSTLAMVRVLQERGIPLCLASARPPAAMLPYIEQLGLTGQNAGFNGGIIFKPDGTTSVSRVLSQDMLSIVHDMLHLHGIETWFLRQSYWMVQDAYTPFVQHEQGITGLTPHQVPDLRKEFEGIGKVMGVSSDTSLLQDVETELAAMLHGDASVRRSSDILLDVTPALANKGEAVRELARAHGIAPHEVACLGDAHNDLPMFSVAGLGIAMGQAEDDVKAAAQVLTDTNERDGWAKAVERYILPRVPNP